MRAFLRAALVVLAFCAPGAAAPSDEDPLDPFGAYAGRAREALAAHAIEDAFEWLERARRELRGAPPPSHAALVAHAWLVAGRPQEALDAIDGARGPEPFAELEAARALVALGRNAEALERLGRLLEHYPAFGHARRARAELWLAGGRAAEARVELTALVAAAPDDGALALAAARAEHAVGERDAALARLDAWIADRPGPEGAPARVQLVEWSLASGDAERAHAVARALHVPGLPERAYLVALDAARARGAWLEAWDATFRALDASSEGTRALDVWLDDPALGPEFRVAFARERMRRAPGATSAASLARALGDAGRVDEALEVLTGLDGAAREAHRRLEARLLRRAGRLDEAADALARAPADDGEAAYDLGLVESERGRGPAAVAAFERAARIAAGRDQRDLAADAEEARAAVFERALAHADAARALDAALVHDPTRRDAWLRLARLARLRLGDRPRAVAAYRRFFELGGVDADGRAYVDAGR